MCHRNGDRISREGFTDRTHQVQSAISRGVSAPAKNGKFQSQNAILVPALRHLCLEWQCGVQLVIYTEADILISPLGTEIWNRGHLLNQEIIQLG